MTEEFATHQPNPAAAKEAPQKPPLTTSVFKGASDLQTPKHDTANSYDPPEDHVEMVGVESPTEINRRAATAKPFHGPLFVNWAVQEVEQDWYQERNWESQVDFFHVANAWGQSRRAATSTAPQCYTFSFYSTAIPAPMRTVKSKTNATQIHIGPNILVVRL